jgi:hypothetical protein
LCVLELDLHPVLQSLALPLTLGLLVSNGRVYRRHAASDSIEPGQLLEQIKEVHA